MCLHLNIFDFEVTSQASEHFSYDAKILQKSLSAKQLKKVFTNETKRR